MSLALLHLMWSRPNLCMWHWYHSPPLFRSPVHCWLSFSKQDIWETLVSSYQEAELERSLEQGQLQQKLVTLSQFHFFLMTRVVSLESKFLVLILLDSDQQNRYRSISVSYEERLDCLRFILVIKEWYNIWASFHQVTFKSFVAIAKFDKFFRISISCWN